MGRYLELHIEQGKVLEEYQTEVGIVGTVAGTDPVPGVFERNGGTFRSDADGHEVTLCTAAEIILELERSESRNLRTESVTTVGVIQNYPNVLNVIPGRVEIGVDMRGIDQDSLNCMERNFKAAVRKAAKSAALVCGGKRSTASRRSG